MGVMAWGMWRARYWAVLGFQLSSSSSSSAPSSASRRRRRASRQVIGTLALLAVAGTLFFFMVKAMARIQMPERAPRDVTSAVL